MILAYIFSLTLKPGVRCDNTRRMKYIRKYVRRREKNRCRRRFCGGKDLEVHHKIPVSEGGGHSPRNLELICHYHHSLIHPWLQKQRRNQWKPKFLKRS